MVARTPHLKGEENLGPLASRYVDTASLPWTSTASPNVDMKILLEDKSTGLLTAIVRFAPGSKLGYHEHVEIEQSYILEGHLVDDEGEAKAGDFVWRPKGSRHVARSPDGAMVLAFFLRPNVFFLSV